MCIKIWVSNRKSRNVKWLEFRASQPHGNVVFMYIIWTICHYSKILLRWLFTLTFGRLRNLTWNDRSGIDSFRTVSAGTFGWPGDTFSYNDLEDNKWCEYVRVRDAHTYHIWCWWYNCAFWLRKSSFQNTKSQTY